MTGKQQDKQEYEIKELYSDKKYPNTLQASLEYVSNKSKDNKRKIEEFQLDFNLADEATKLLDVVK